jgi:pimeloyl-ACP methyl ester carboxylesterase
MSPLTRPSHLNRLGRPLAAASAGASAGLILGLTMPRGPMTTTQSLLALALALAAGALAAWALRSRWAALLAPAAMAGVFEVARLGTPGPSVGPIRLDTVYGVVAFIAGRGFDALVILLPMVVGALWAAALVRRRGPARATAITRSPGRSLGRSPGRSLGRRVARRGTLALATVAVVVLALALARPTGTEAITGADGSPLPGSIAELVTVPIGGHDQSIMLRGNDIHAPVLLFLEGGPGGTAVGQMRASGKGLERSFVVATWDQRGTGKSAAAMEPVATFTVAQAVRDTIAVSQYLRGRFGQSRIYLVGSSWGTTLGVLTARQRPDLFHAYVGTGQMVDQQETDKLMYAESLAYARRAGDAGFASRLQAIGTPPYNDPLAYPVAIASNPQWRDYTPGPDHDARSAYPASLFVPELSFTEQVRSMAALIDTFAWLYPQLQDIDFRRDVRRLDVPVYVVEGAHEAPGRAVLAREWFAALSAPGKHLVTFEHSGHNPHLDEPGRFATFMQTVVLRQTRPGTQAGAAGVARVLSLHHACCRR